MDRTTGVITPGTPDTTVGLPAGENLEEIAENFNDNTIEKGSLVYCNLVDAGGGRNFTVQLELRQVSEDDEQDD